MECEGFIKGLITDDILTINEKGKSQYDIKSYHRFIATTNNEEPLSTGNDDRRNLIIKCSDELCGNKEYFDKFYELIEDINSIKSYYEYLKKIPEMNMFGKIPLPVTEYHAELKTMSEKAIERWIKDFTQENYNKVDVRLTALSVYDNFCDWITKNGSNYTCSNMQFGVRLTRLKVKGVEKKHTSKGCVYTFNIKEMECSLGLGCLITA
jgi:phage/plasmid-associated DNA primase